MTAPHSSSSGVAAGALILLLISCGSAPTRIYTLYPVAPASIAPYAGPPIRIDAVHVPPALDRLEVISNITPGELKVRDLDHWSAPLAEIAKQALSADIVARLPPGRVIFPHLAKPEDALGVSVDILDFRTDAKGPSLEASWTITGSDPGKVARRGTAQFSANGSSTDAFATANALSALLAQLADRIAGDLTQEPR